MHVSRRRTADFPITEDVMPRLAKEAEGIALH